MSEGRLESARLEGSRLEGSRPDPGLSIAAAPDLGVELAPHRPGHLRLRHPIIVAAGGAGLGVELLDSTAGESPGAIVTRSIAPSSHPGGKSPRMVASRLGLLSSIGPAGAGIDTVLRYQAPRWEAADVPIIASICADDAAGIASLAGALDGYPGVAGVELNLGCPDRSRRGAPIGLDTETSEIATVTARAATDLPLVVKLSAVAPDVREIARAVAAAGADAIAAIDTVPALSIAPERQRAALGATYGGLSGAALRPIALRVVYEVAQVVRIPVIGIGGIASLDDVLDFLAAGATAVGMATAVLADPALPGRLALDLDAWCRKARIDSVAALVGTALPKRRDRGSLRSSPYRRAP